MCSSEPLQGCASIRIGCTYPSFTAVKAATRTTSVATDAAATVQAAGQDSARAAGSIAAKALDSCAPFKHKDNISPTPLQDPITAARPIAVHAHAAHVAFSKYRSHESDVPTKIRISSPYNWLTGTWCPCAFKHSGRQLKSNTPTRPHHSSLCCCCTCRCCSCVRSCSFRLPNSIAVSGSIRW